MREADAVPGARKAPQGPRLCLHAHRRLTRALGDARRQVPNFACPRSGDRSWHVAEHSRRLGTLSWKGLVGMKVYVAICSRDEGGYWNASVPEVPGAHTFARRLDQIPGQIKEALRLFPESVPAEFDVELEPRLPDSMQEMVRQANEVREHARRAAEQANEQTRAAAAALRSGGLPMRDVGELLHVSHQRVAQLLAAVPREPRN